jgi:DNA-binding Xre family transcriptional regulator
MYISYKKLWKLMIDRDIRKKDLREMTGLSPSTIAKLGKNEVVNTSVIIRICNALQCDLCDIMEIIHDDKGDEVYG